jgi:hypothetical protein
LVEALSKALSAHHGNWLESRIAGQLGAWGAGWQGVGQVRNAVPGDSRGFS